MASHFASLNDGFGTHVFNEKTAREIYQKMLGESLDTERGEKIVEYLYPVLGEKPE